MLVFASLAGVKSRAAAFAGPNHSANESSAMKFIRTITSLWNKLVIGGGQASRAIRRRTRAARRSRSRKLLFEHLEEIAVLSTVSAMTPSPHVPEGNMATVYISVNPPSSTPVTATYQTNAGTAIEDTDYDGVTGSVTIYPGQPYAAVSIPVLHDFSADPGETFSLTITGATGATVGTPSSTTITIDDVAPSGTPPGILVDGSGGSEGSTVSLTGSWYDPLGGPGNRAVTVNWGDGTVDALSLPPSFTVTHTYADDGPSPGNGTPFDTHNVGATLHTPYNYSTTGYANVTINNVAPAIVDDPENPEDGPVVDFVRDAEGDVLSATLSGSFVDPGLPDGHRLSVMWGDELSPTASDLALGSRTFTVTRNFDDPVADSDTLFPIVINISDDDLGSTAYILHKAPCDCGGDDIGGGSQTPVSAPAPPAEAMADDGEGGEVNPNQPVVAATSFQYVTAPAAATLYPMGFQFQWEMHFNEAARNLVAHQRVEYTLTAFDKAGVAVHTATLDLRDLAAASDGNLQHPPFFFDTQDMTQGPLAGLINNWVTNDKVCSLTFVRRGDMRLVDPAGIQVVINGVTRAYDPAIDPSGMVYALFTVDGVAEDEYSVTFPPGGGPPTTGPKIFDTIRFIGNARYRAVWEERVDTTVAWIGIYGFRDPQYTMKGSIIWKSNVGGAAGAAGLAVFPEKAAFDVPQPWIDVTATKIRTPTPTSP
jgi:hypothetical protein